MQYLFTQLQKARILYTGVDLQGPINSAFTEPVITAGTRTLSCPLRRVPSAGSFHQQTTTSPSSLHELSEERSYSESPYTVITICHFRSVVFPPSILDWAFRKGCCGFGLTLLCTVIWRAERNHKRSCLFHYFFFWPLLPTHWHSHRHTYMLGRTPMGEWSALRRDLYLTTQNIERQTSMPRRDSNPQSQHSSGLRPTPWTARPPVSVVCISVL